MWYDENLHASKDADSKNRLEDHSNLVDMKSRIQNVDLCHDPEPKSENCEIPNEELSELHLAAENDELANYKILDNIIDLKDATLEELLEAELPNSTSEEPDAHLAILAAFENSLKVETVAKDVNEVCEEIKDLTLDKPIPMPECTKWQGVEPVSRFGLGGTVDSSGKGGSNIFVSGFVLARPMLLASTVLASLAVVGIAYSGPVSVFKFIIDFVPPSSEQAQAIKSANTGIDEVELARILTAEAGETDQQNVAPIVVGKPVLAKTAANNFNPTTMKSGERLMSGSSTYQEGGVTVVEKMPEQIVEPDFIANQAKPVKNTQDAGTIASTEAGRIGDKTLVSDDNRSGSVGTIYDDAKNPAVDKLVAALSPNDLGVQPRPVKIVSIVPKIAKPMNKRSKESVKSAMLHAKAAYTLSEDQKRQLVPKLVNGACVAVSLQEVAGRVSPVLMRDLLARLKSDC